MKLAEKIISITFLVGLLMIFYQITGGGLITTLSLVSISSIYMAFSLLLFNQLSIKELLQSGTLDKIGRLRIIGSILLGLSLSVLTLGILFKIQLYPGASAMLKLGLIGVSVALLIGAIKYIKSRDIFYKSIFKRIIIFGGIGLFFYLLPKANWLTIRFPDNPDYVQAVINYDQNPRDSTSIKRLQIEREKMFKGQ